MSVAGGFTGCANRNTPLYPTHIESPDYDCVARIAHIEGQVVVTATIGVDGSVIDAHAVGPPMLVKGAVANLKLWKFEKPKKSRRQQTIVYDYKMEDAENPASCDAAPPPPPKISFDLPQHVEITAEGVVLCDPIGTIPGKKHR